MPGPRFAAVVEHDEESARCLQAFLEAHGQAARLYPHGDQLVAAVRAGDIPALVLLDISAPETDGLATLRSLRELHADCSVIVFTDHTRAATIVEAIRLGAADCVVAPLHPTAFDTAETSELASAIVQALERVRPGLPVSPREEREERDEPERAWWAGDGPMREVARLVDRVADSDVTVLVRGESGVGKELVTRALHRRSPRARGPLVRVNCAALPAELLESELFGHERGAFTGADAMRIGKFEHARGGTILLDEIGEMSATLQGKLLHVLQDGCFTRLGSNKPVSVDARVVAATNRDLEGMIGSGQFREDLYYRLKVIEIVIPPLRERRDEIPRLVSRFLAKFSAQYGRPKPPVSERLHRLLLAHPWPGNIRELENCLKRYVLLQDPLVIERELSVELRRPLAGDAPAPVLGSVALPEAETISAAAPAADEALPMRDVAPVREARGSEQEVMLAERQGAEHPARTLPDIAREASERAERVEIERALTAAHWNRRRAAEQLGVSYKTLLNKIRELRIDAE